MFERTNFNELKKPPNAKNPYAVEVLRVWAEPGQPQQLVLKTTWKEPEAWGLLLADVARHAANAYAREGHDQSETLSRILNFFDAEMAKPTDAARKLLRSPVREP